MKNAPLGEAVRWARHAERTLGERGLATNAVMVEMPEPASKKGVRALVFPYSAAVSDSPRIPDDRALFERGPVVLFKWRNEPGWPVEYVSSNVLDVLGYGAEELLSGAVSYGQLVFEDDLERVGREVTEATSSGATSFAHEPYRLRRRGGEIVWMYDHTHVVRDGAGVTTHYLGYVFDVTSRMVAAEEKLELERRLLHAQKLESLGVLAGGVAHDFNNLLTGILGQASLARKQLASRGALDGRDEGLLALERGVGHIEQLALRAAELTQKLLAYSGKGPVVVEPVDLGHLLDDMASILALILSKNAKVVRDLAPNLPSVMADRAQLQQIVMNLLTNASDALADEHGTITLRTSVSTLDSAAAVALDVAPGKYVTFEVTDTGCGMADEAKTRLFEPFFTTKFSGRGLGMSAVLGIVRGHRGAISVSSRVGVGSHFTIHLPATEAPSVPRAPEPTLVAWRGEGTVLVADDQRSIRTTLGLLLGSLGFETVMAADGKEAVELFEARRHEIVLVLLDMTMPVMSGVDAMRAIRVRDAHVPIILSTGYSEEEATEKSDGQSAVFLQKPYRVEELESAIRAALATRS